MWKNRAVGAAMLCAAVLSTGACEGLFPSSTEPSPPEVSPTTTTAASPTSASPSPTDGSIDGTYDTIITRDEFEGFEPDIYPPDMFAGFYLLEIEGDTYRLMNDGFGEINGQIDVKAEAGVLLFEDIPAPKGAFNCVDSQGDRADTRKEGTGTYDFELEGDTLDLRSVEEPCHFRGFLMERSWVPAQG